LDLPAIIIKQIQVDAQQKITLIYTDTAKTFS